MTMLGRKERRRARTSEAAGRQWHAWEVSAYCGLSDDSEEEN